ncbi:MAG: hypothetical protein IH609_12680 [Dehalococcoidia bacterium]|nr:hypothetical protein [Dehalococcoidia bacterium]
MTAKEALRNRIDRLTEDQAAEWLARMEWESTEFEHLTDAERAEVRESQAEYERGEALDGEKVLRDLGL